MSGTRWPPNRPGLQDESHDVHSVASEASVAGDAAACDGKGGTGAANTAANAQSDTAKPALVLIKDIPRKIRSADMRRIFERFLESSGFVCFHYRHRPQPASSSKDQPDTSSFSQGDDSQPTQYCCCVVLVDSQRLDNLLRDYAGEPWFPDPAADNISPEDLRHKIRMVKLQDTEIAKAKRLPELNPPPGMPRGNVGTPTQAFRELISKCLLPPKVVSKLGLDFGRHRRRKFGQVDMTYTQTKRPDTASSTMEPTRGDKASPQRQRASDQEPKVKRPKLQRNVRDAEHRQAASFGAAQKMPFPKEEEGEGAVEDDEEEDADAEEWDRHLALHPELEDAGQDRAKEKLFERDVEQVWDKGDASALVFYTDAYYWDKQEGSFEERTTDDFDVDMDRYYNYSEGDRDARALAELRASGWAPSVGMRGRRHDPEAGVTPEEPAHDFRQGVGAQLLRRHGWREGQPVGRRSGGLVEPIEPEGATDPRQRFGLGYREYGSSYRRGRRRSPSSSHGME